MKKKPKWKDEVQKSVEGDENSIPIHRVKVKIATLEFYDLTTYLMYHQTDA